MGPMMKIENQKVVVTGADGFIGSHLVEMLVAEGARVKALSCYNSFGSWGWLDESSFRNDIEVISGDVRDPHFCKKLVEGVDLVFHLAALIGIPYSYIAPKSYVDTNVNGTLNICQAALESGCQRVIHTSTSEVYGSAKYVPIDEKHPLQAQSPYSASKIGADALAMSYFNAFELPLTIARPFNTYGPRQSMRAIIPTIISQLAASKKEIRLGDLSPTRDLNYVADTCRGFIALAQSSDSLGETVNIGSGKEISMKDLFATLSKVMQSDAVAIMDAQRLRPEKSEVQRLCCDNSKIKKMTDWQPQITLQQGLEKTVAWFLDPIRSKIEKTDVYHV